MWHWKKEFRSILGHYGYVVMPFELTFVIITFHMVICKLPCGSDVVHIPQVLEFRSMQEACVNRVQAQREFV
jgi:hypothetical protein